MIANGVTTAIVCASGTNRRSSSSADSKISVAIIETQPSAGTSATTDPISSVGASRSLHMHENAVRVMHMRTSLASTAAVAMAVAMIATGCDSATDKYTRGH